MTAAFARIRRFLGETSGIAVEDEKRYFVEDRLQPVLRSAGLRSLDELAQALEADRTSDLARSVAETLTINETSFFRDRALFSALNERLLPRLLATNEPTRRLRIWCAGCSTGQEPYSIAMVIDEQMRHRRGWRVEILATDLSRRVIEQARRGIYSQFEVQRGLPTALLLRHFSKTGAHWQISEYLRAKVRFEPGNLLAAPPSEGPFDIIFCRNVLFYFDGATKRRVLGRLSGALAPRGLLILGAAERPGGLCPDLQPDAAPFVFAREAECERAAKPSRERDPQFA